ncbi:class I SAM-dependent methyltransferase [Mycobacterium sp.]|jgi:methyltransferase (TIGR00027 family)|uniref:class I SAM-dependent methyltransferase n=1 Tax=Mycobacterium sp. TaxID=1785 RepID=UPI002D5B5C95|nr:class I SAM-dependent methyltransferase [Mycobacterium sp.]HZA09587.1 class I SAM-dependent methyltransferase [Mycobacterium sp.]
MTRTDNDSWDLANSVGATATMVAAYRAAASKRDEPLIDDPFAEPLVRAVGIDFFSRLAGGEFDAVNGADGDLMNLMTDVFAARTRYFDGFVADAARAGIRQVVIVASGLDSRPYRLAWPAGTTVYEIDQPEVIGFKSKTLADLGGAPTADRRTVGVDLRQDWPAALREAGFDPAEPTAWLAEGLLIGFLPGEAQDRLLDNITDLSAAGSRFAGDYVPGRSDVEAFQERMETISGQWRDRGLDVDIANLTYSGERHDVAAYLAAQGWEPVRATITDLFAGGGLRPLADDTETFSWIVYVTATRTRA